MIGVISALLFLMFPTSLSMARCIKPHLVGVGWAIASLYYALTYYRVGRFKDLIYSSLLAGLSMGTVITYGVSVLFPVIALLISNKPKKMIHLLTVTGVAGLVFLVTNPYFFLSLNMVKSESAFVVWQAKDRPIGISRFFAMCWGLFCQGASPFITIWFVLWSIQYARWMKDKRELILVFLPPFCYLVLFAIVSRMNSVQPRFGIYLLPYVAFISAYGIFVSIRKWRYWGAILGVMLVTPSVIYATAQLICYRDNANGNVPLYWAASWLRELPAKTTIGCIILPVPGHFPPIPFRRFELITFPDRASSASTEMNALPEYFVMLTPDNPNPSNYRLIKSFIYARPLLKKSWIGMEDPAPDVYIFAKHV